MTIYEEWRIYDPADIRTHPVGTAPIEAVFDNERVVEGIYGDGIFSHSGFGNMKFLGDAKMLRWRYREE